MGLLNVGTRVYLTITKDELSVTNLTDSEQKKIGKIAKSKNCEWYKRINLGEKLGDTVFKYWDSIDKNVKLKKTIKDLSKWVMKND